MNYIEQSFEGLTSAFNTTFEMKDEDVKALVSQTEKSICEIEEKKNELVTNKRELMLRDQSFLEDELRELIISTGAMLAKLEAEIKIGSKSGYFDSYARLVTARTVVLKELRELNVAVVGIENEKKRNGNDINTGRRASIVLDANALMELVDKARENSEINKIDATFVIKENEEK